MAVAEIEYRAVLDRTGQDPNVVGLILSGSRVSDAFVTPASDFDCYVVLGPRG